MAKTSIPKDGAPQGGAEISVLPSAKRMIDSADIRNWLIDQGLKNIAAGDVFQGFCERLAAVGFPLSRAYMAMRTLHPRFGAYGFMWRPGSTGVKQEAYTHESALSDSYQVSPFFYLHQTGTPMVRRRLVGPGAVIDFPILRDLRDEGMTDYAAAIVGFSSDLPGQEGVILSCATDAPGGFRDDDLMQVTRLFPVLGLALKARATYDVANSVIETYLGGDAGHRILSGQIKRGLVKTIRAAIWYCDIRGFTKLADEISREDLIELLNAYLDTLAEPVHAYGGQILKFMGDGFLATFDFDSVARENVCQTVLTAADEARASVARLSETRRAMGKRAVDFGLALHIGEVLYGNVGARNRLDFTIVGPAVNEASRMQDLCRVLDTEIVVSDDFRAAAKLCQNRLVSVGRHSLRGVRDSRELFTLAA